MPSENLPAFWILIMNIKQISSLFFLAGFSLTVHSEPATLEYAPRGEWLRIANEICRYYHQGQRQEQCWSNFNALLQERQACEGYYRNEPWRCASYYDGRMWRWEIDERKDSKRFDPISTQPVTTTPSQPPKNGECTYMSCRRARIKQCDNGSHVLIDSSCPTKPSTGSNPPPTGSNPPPTGSNPPPTGSNPPPTGSNPPPTSSNPPPAGSTPSPTVKQCYDGSITTGVCPSPPPVILPPPPPPTKQCADGSHVAQDKSCPPVKRCPNNTIVNEDKPCGGVSVHGGKNW